MKYHNIDNSLKNLGKAVLWQYDRAVRLLSLMKHIQVVYHSAVEQFWNAWLTKVLSIDTCDEFGASLWGLLLGVTCPTIVDSSGVERQIVPAVYRKYLKAVFYFFKADPTFDNILGFTEMLFGIDGRDSLSKWSGSVSQYGWSINLDELNDVYQENVSYNEGDIVWIPEGSDAGNWLFLRNVPMGENTSWAAISNAVERTEKPTNISERGDSLLLKLYDPEGICRKIGGSPRGALSISVEYYFGETKIVAEATRRQKCGVTITDNGDMSMTYGKSEYFDEMHPDQKALYEQKKDEALPYPLGIKTNDPVPKWVLGFGAEKYTTERYWLGGYEPNRAYRAPGYVHIDVLAQEKKMGTIWYVSHPWTHVCYVSQDISASANTDYLTFENLPGVSLVEDCGPGNEPYMYQANINLPKGLIFNHYDQVVVKGTKQPGEVSMTRPPDYGKITVLENAFCYECLEDIEAEENTSFEAIKGKIRITKDGNPMVSTVVSDDKAYIDIRKIQYPYRKLGKSYYTTSEGKCLEIYSIENGVPYLAPIDGVMYSCTNGYVLRILLGSHSYDEMYYVVGKVRNTTEVWVYVKEGDSLDDIMVFLGKIAEERGYGRELYPESETFSTSGVGKTLRKGSAIYSQRYKTEMYFPIGNERVARAGAGIDDKFYAWLPLVKTVLLSSETEEET